MGMLGMLSCILLLSIAPSRADEIFQRGHYFQWPERLYEGADYDPAIPAPSTILGFQPGEWFPTPEQTRTYLEALAAASPRLNLSVIGRTYEGRPLLLATISSEANLARQDDIRRNLVRLRSEPMLESSAALEEILADTPAVVWLTYSVHGNEHSGTDAALRTAYHLAADRSAATQRWLDSVVILLDPMQNPDGRQRFLRWQEATIARDPRGAYRPDPDPMAAEHHEPWPSGRFNHYLFDLNRDWFFLTQAESRAKVKVLRDWNPQVVVDLHEMGTDQTYFFPPPANPINPQIPESLRRWWKVFGVGNARALDRVGVDYYTAEIFDSFYPGYGDSLPTLYGAIGMTYEQASTRGLAQQRSDGSVLTLREALWHHFLTSLATIDTAATHRRALLADFRLFFRESIGSGAASGEIWIQPSADGGTTRDLAQHLAQLGVQVLFPDGEVTNPRLQPLTEDHPAPASLSPEGFLIPLAQPQQRLIRTLFDRDISLDEAFLREEEARRRRKEPDSFYDITSWNMALAYGVDAYFSDRASSGPTTARPPAPEAGVRGEPGALAYLMSYDSNDAAAALVDLLAQEPPLRVQMAMKGFRMVDRRFAPGTVVVKSTGGPPDLRQNLESLARRHQVVFHGVHTGLSDEGIDLGSAQVVNLRKPRIGLYWGAPASPPSAGWMAYLLEQRYGLDFTRLNPNEVREGELGDFEVLLFPSTKASDPLGEGYRDFLGEEGIAHLGEWIDSGGVFVGFGGGAGLAALPDVGWTSAGLALKPQEEDGGTDSPDSDEEDTLDADDLPESTPGAMVRVRLDRHHFLTAGYGSSAVVPMLSRLAFQPGEKTRSAAVFEEEDRLVVSGFMWDDTRRAVAGESYLVTEERGRGKVILFASEPAYRAYWPALHRLFLNAVLLGPHIRVVSALTRSENGSR